MQDRQNPEDTSCEKNGVRHTEDLFSGATEPVQADEALRALVEFEDAIARISGSFVNLAPEHVDDGIQRALQTMAEAYHVERAYVFQFSGDRKRMDCTHEWCAGGIEPQIHKMKDVPISVLGWTAERIIRLEVVQIRSASDLPPEADNERAELQSLGLRSRIVVPMVYRGVPVGFVGFDTTRARQWTEQSLKLQVIGDIFVNALEHKRAQAIQAGQRQFLELLATGRTFSDTLHTLLRIIEEQWPGMLGLILLLDEDGRHLHIGAAVSLPEDYVQSIEGLEIGPMAGSCGTACYRRERVIVEDTATDPRWDGLRDLALRYGLRACWSEPVFSPDDRVVGTFAVYYRQPRAPTEAELRAIEMGAHLVGVAIEHERTQQALRNSELRFRAVFEGAPIGVSVTSLEGQLLETNRALQQMFGYTGQELYNLDVSEFSHPEDMAVDADLFFNELVPGKRDGYQMEKRFIRKNGEMFWGRLSLSLARGQQGQPLFAIATTEDITEQKQAKQALEDAYQTLEHRVDERTKELATLNAIASVASHSLDLGEIMNAALDKTLEATDMEFGTAYGLEGSREQSPAIAMSKPDNPDAAGLESVRQMMRAPQEAPGQTGEADRLRLLAYRGVSTDYAEFVRDVRLPATAAALARVGKPFVWLVEEAVPSDTPFRRYLEREGCRQVVTLPLIAKGNLVGAINLGTRTPRTFTSEQLSLFAAVGQQIGVAVDNARLYEAEQQRLEEAERRQQVAEGMREILAALNSRQSLEAMLDLIVTQACRVLGSDGASLLRQEGKAGPLKIQSACGLEADYVAGLSLALRRGAAGRVLSERQPITISDTLSAAELRELAGLLEPERTWLEHLLPRFRALLWVPLIVQDEAYGAITLYYHEPREFSEEELRLAMSVAHQAALAIESARLREQAEQSATLAERSRLARELHDSVTQSLYSVTLYAEAAARLLAEGNHQTAGDYLRELRDTAQEALREMRLLIFELRPPELEKVGLAAALQARLKAVEVRGGLQTELQVEGMEGGREFKQLPLAIQGELYHITQEALNNVLKHAKAHQVHVHLRLLDTGACVEVWDDGCGFEPARIQEKGGLGIAGMHERAQRIGGHLLIESAPGTGTKVTITVPLSFKEVP